MRSLKSNLKSSVMAVPVAMGIFGWCLAPAHAQFPNYGNDTNGPSQTITIASNGSVSIANTGGYANPANPYDGSDDTYVGVINNSSAAVSSLNLSSATLDIFGFDFDGIDTYGAPGNTTDTTGYGGPQSYFTNISADDMSGTVNFVGGLQPGASTYFSLEEALTATNVVVSTPLPPTWIVLLLGLAGIGYGSYRSGTKRASTATGLA